jgi:hypothetical protein
MRNSPQYWGCKKTEISSMIRQLSSPTFLITFSQVEVDCTELIVKLAKVLDKKYYHIRGSFGKSLSNFSGKVAHKSIFCRAFKQSFPFNVRNVITTSSDPCSLFSSYFIGFFFSNRAKICKRFFLI